jgi:beta-lactamase regulating signal transducer with metallopeptidase domain
MTAYIIKSSVCLLLMFGLYWFLLRKEKIFGFNRFFLLFSIIFSLALPFVSIPVSIPNNITQVSILTTFNSMPFYSSQQNALSSLNYQSLNETEPEPTSISDEIDFSQILRLLYITGVLLLLVRFIRNILLIYRQILKSEKTIYSGQRLVLTNNQINPFCFFNTIFVSRKDYLNSEIDEELLSHELEHVRQSHSVDVIFVELIKIIYWFNPILILFSRAIKVNHEYLADNGVVRGSSDIKDYADKLINYISCKQNIPLTSGFNPTLTRKRLIMLTKSKSGVINYGARIFVTINLMVALFLLVSFTPSYSKPFTTEQNMNVFSNKKTEKAIAFDTIQYKILPSKTEDKLTNSSIVLNHTEMPPKTQNDTQQVNVGGIAAATNMNVLYLGIPNPVEIAVPGVTSDKVTAMITNGSINRTRTGWEVKPSSFSDVVLTILVNNKKVNEKIFRVKPIPVPVAVFAHRNIGSVSKDDVLKASTLEAELKDFLWDLKFEIVSFTFFFSSDGSEREIPSKGNTLTDEMKSFISDLKSGQYIIFKDIKALGPDGKIHNLNPLILKID